MKISQIIFISTMAIGMFFTLFYFLMKIREKSDVRKFGSVDRKLVFGQRMKHVRELISKNRTAGSLVRKFGLRLSVFNSRTQEENENNAVLIFACCIILNVLFSVAAAIFSFPFWYMGALYSLIFLGITLFSFLFVSEMSRDAFTKHMPETLRIINSRYSTRGNILKAIAVSMDDFHPVVRKEMVRIYDALKQNDMEKIRSTFDETEEKYSGEYVMLMLELINHAYYNGGSPVVREQFDTIAEDVIAEMENRKDIRSAATGYIVMAILFIPMLPVSVLFNNGILGDTSASYYGGQESVIYTACFFLAVFLIVAIIVFVERDEKM